MKKQFWDHRIPTIPAFILILVSIWVTLYLVKTNTFVTTKASPDIEPSHITIGNITDTSFTVAFTTRSKVSAAIKTSTDTGQEVVHFDSRDTSGIGNTPFFSHIFTVNSVQPNTSYRFSILVEDKTHLDNGNPFVVTTAPSMNDPGSSQKTPKGTILLPDSQPADDTLVIASYANGQTLLAVTDVHGAFTIPLPVFRTADLSTIQEFSDSDILSLQAFRENASSDFSSPYKYADDIPTVTLSENYTFDLESLDTGTASISSELSLPDAPANASRNTISISSPRESQTFLDYQPTFRGTAYPQQKVRVLITSGGRLEAEVLTDSAGLWSYRPTTPLAAGSYSITIQSADNFNIIRSATQSFSVLPSGSQVSETATPSATPTVIITPSPTRTAPTNTPTPTLAQSSPTPTTTAPSATPTIQPTATPTMYPTATPTPILSLTPTPPGSAASIVITFLSVLFIIAGTTLFFIVS